MNFEGLPCVTMLPLPLPFPTAGEQEKGPPPTREGKTSREENWWGRVGPRRGARQGTGMIRLRTHR